MESNKKRKHPSRYDDTHASKIMYCRGCQKQYVSKGALENHEKICTQVKLRNGEGFSILEPFNPLRSPTDTIGIVEKTALPSSQDAQNNNTGNIDNGGEERAEVNPNSNPNNDNQQQQCISS